MPVAMTNQRPVSIVAMRAAHAQTIVMDGDSACIVLTDAVATRRVSPAVLRCVAMSRRVTMTTTWMVVAPTAAIRRMTRPRRPVLLLATRRCGTVHRLDE